MPGAASLIAANHGHRVAQCDGLTIVPEVDPIVGEQFEEVVNELFGLNATVVARLRELLR